MKRYIEAAESYKTAKSNYVTEKPAPAEKELDKLSRGAEVCRFSCWLVGALRKASREANYSVNGLRNDVVREVRAARAHLGKELKDLPSLLTKEVDMILWKKRPLGK